MLSTFQIYCVITLFTYLLYDTIHVIVLRFDPGICVKRKFYLLPRK